MLFCLLTTIKILRYLKSIMARKHVLSHRRFQVWNRH